MSAMSGVYLITGASRGLGLELTRQLLSSGHRVIGACRNPIDVKRNLKKLLGKDEVYLAYQKRLTPIKLDIVDEKSIEDAVVRVREKFGSRDEDGDIEPLHEEEPLIDCVINNAGVALYLKGGRKEDSKTTSWEIMRKALDINTLGAMFVTKAFYGLLKKRSRDSNGAKVANMSSIFGSNTDSSAGAPSYRISKAALNMVSTCQARDFKSDGITVLSLHPGWVHTDMGSRGGRSPPLKPPESCAGMLKVIEEATIKDSGTFFNWKGEKVGF